MAHRSTAEYLRIGTSGDLYRPEASTLVDPAVPLIARCRLSLPHALQLDHRGVEDRQSEESVVEHGAILASQGVVSSMSLHPTIDLLQRSHSTAGRIPSGVLERLRGIALDRRALPSRLSLGRESLLRRLPVRQSDLSAAQVDVRSRQRHGDQRTRGIRTNAAGHRRASRTEPVQKAAGVSDRSIQAHHAEQSLASAAIDAQCHLHESVSLGLVRELLRRLLHRARVRNTDDDPGHLRRDARTAQWNASELLVCQRYSLWKKRCPLHWSEWTTKGDLHAAGLLLAMLSGGIAASVDSRMLLQQPVVSRQDGQCDQSNLLHARHSSRCIASDSFHDRHDDQRSSRATVRRILVLVAVLRELLQPMPSGLLLSHGDRPKECSRNRHDRRRTHRRSLRRPSPSRSQPCLNLRSHRSSIPLCTSKRRRSFSMASRRSTDTACQTHGLEHIREGAPSSDDRSADLPATAIHSRLRRHHPAVTVHSDPLHVAQLAGQSQFRQGALAGRFSTLAESLRTDGH